MQQRLKLGGCEDTCKTVLKMACFDNSGRWGKNAQCANSFDCGCKSQPRLFVVCWKEMLSTLRRGQMDD